MRIDTDIQLCSIKKNIIDKLPQEIVRKIYREYLESEMYFTIYKNIIKNPISQELNGKILKPFVPIILSKPDTCKYISQNCHAFNYSFIQHKINKKKVFRLMNNKESFAATILFSLYH